MNNPAVQEAYNNLSLQAQTKIQKRMKWEKATRHFWLPLFVFYSLMTILSLPTILGAGIFGAFAVQCFKARKASYLDDMFETLVLKACKKEAVFHNMAHK